jgi:hypothetical protein
MRKTAVSESPRDDDEGRDSSRKHDDTPENFEYAETHIKLLPKMSRSCRSVEGNFGLQKLRRAQSWDNSIFSNIFGKDLIQL